MLLNQRETSLAVVIRYVCALYTLYLILLKEGVVIRAKVGALSQKSFDLQRIILVDLFGVWCCLGMCIIIWFFFMYVCINMQFGGDRSTQRFSFPQSLWSLTGDYDWDGGKATYYYS